MIIVAIVGPTAKEALAQIRRARAQADLLELRLDLIHIRDVRELISRAGRIPVIATCRPKWEGGAFIGSEQARVARLADAVENGATYIDVECDALTSKAPFVKELWRFAEVICSHHLRPGQPVNVLREFSRLAGTNPAVVKFAYHAGDSHHCRFAFEFLALARAGGLKAVAIGMGPAGEATRILYRKFGGWATFASSGEGKESAPGQLSVRELKEVFRADRLNEKTRVFGLIGNPVAQSKGVYLHNAQFSEARVNAVYCRFLTEDLRKFMLHISPHIEGMSVTLPHKEAIVKYLDVLDKRARTAGAVNTVWRKGGRLMGSNTDAPAALDAIEAVTTVAGKSMLVFGGGGAARAVVSEALDRGAAVAVTGRSDTRIRALARHLAAGWVPWRLVRSARGRIADIVVNTTPVGMYPSVGRSVVPRAITRGIVAVDAIYNPPVTRFLADARSRGSKIVSGMEWFVAQAVHQSRVFGVVRPDSALMRRILLRRMRMS